jgi:hypothetical protein
MRLLVDSDAFCKLGCCTLLDRALGLFEATTEDCGRLPALPHMLRRGRLVKTYGRDACTALVPVAEAMAIAPPGTTQYLDSMIPVDNIDVGEAQLFASAATHALPLLTGDKRALRALAAVPGMHVALGGRIVPLDLVLLELCRKHGVPEIRNAVAPVMKTDVGLSVCFSPSADPLEALGSYLRALQSEVSPLVLKETLA